MKLYAPIVSLCLLFFACAPARADFQDTVFDLKDIHGVVFDLYFPEGVLSTTEKKKRLELREILWVYLQSRPEILGLLNLLQPSSSLLPHDLKADFSDIIVSGVARADKDRIRQLQFTLRRHPDNNIRKFTSILRRCYCYLAYSSPLTSKISGCEAVKPADIPERTVLLPATRLQRLEDKITHMDGPIDYLIVGSGPAGSMIAHELTIQKPGSHVVLIDSGSFIKPQSIVTESSSELMESNNMRTTVSGGIFLRNGRALGGGTIVNLDLAFSPLLPQIKKKIQGWIDAGLLDASLIHEGQESDWKMLQDAYTYVSHHLATRAVDVAEVNENNKVLLAATPTARTYDLNARRPTCPSDTNLKISALDTFILPAVSQGLSIIPDVQVKRVIFDACSSTPHACGVEIEFAPPLNQAYSVTDPNGFNALPGERAVIEAKNVIVCAGALGSAEVLLRSNVNNSNIGKGIVIHPSVGMYGRFDREIDVMRGLSASVYAPAEKAEDDYFFESMSADPTFVALINFGSGNQILDTVRDVKYLAGFGIMLIDSPHPDNRVFIDPATNQVQVDYALQEGDKQRLRKGLGRGLEMLFEQGAYEAHIPSCEPILGNSEKYIPFTTKAQIDNAMKRLQFIENQNFISSAHMQGSNKMGDNPQTSVVSRNFKVWDQGVGGEIDNLYVCDSSIFPTSVGANPMQSIYTVAKLFADRLARA